MYLRATTRGFRLGTVKPLVRTYSGFALSDSAAGIRDNLKEYLDSNDELLVAKLSGSWVTFNVNESGTDWLYDHM